jgi:hypothetical protein
MLLGSEMVMQGEHAGDEFGGFPAWSWDVSAVSQFACG